MNDLFKKIKAWYRESNRHIHAKLGNTYLFRDAAEWIVYGSFNLPDACYLVRHYLFSHGCG